MWASWIGSPVVLDVNCDGVGVKGVLPTVHQALNCLNQAILGDGVEEADQVVVDCVKVHRIWCVVEVVVEVVP